MGRPPERNAQIVRLLNVIRDLDRLGGVDIYELAQRYGTTERTIRRDLDAIAEAGLPLVEVDGDGRKKRWMIQYRAHLSQFGQLVDASHYLALRVAMNQSGALRTSSSLFAALEDLSNKLEQVLGKKTRDQLAAIESALYSYEKFAYRKAPAEVLWPLVEAIAGKRLCRVRYRSPGADDKTFRVLPLRVFAYRGALYVHAWVPRFETVILLHLHRLVELKPLDETAKAPPNVNLDDWEHGAFGIYNGGTPVEFRLKFTKKVRPVVEERVWHPTQAMHPTRDGGVELTFKCGDSLEVRGWIAGWGDAVEVLEPRSLRRQLAGHGRWLTATYGDTDLAESRNGARR